MRERLRRWAEPWLNEEHRTLRALCRHADRASAMAVLEAMALPMHSGAWEAAEERLRLQGTLAKLLPKGVLFKLHNARFRRRVREAAMGRSLSADYHAVGSGPPDPPPINLLGVSGNEMN